MSKPGACRFKRPLFQKAWKAGRRAALSEARAADAGAYQAWREGFNSLNREEAHRQWQEWLLRRDQRKDAE